MIAPRFRLQVTRGSETTATAIVGSEVLEPALAELKWRAIEQGILLPTRGLPQQYRMVPDLGEPASDEGATPAPAPDSLRGFKLILDEPHPRALELEFSLDVFQLEGELLSRQQQLRDARNEEEAEADHDSATTDADTRDDPPTLAVSLLAEDVQLEPPADVGFDFQFEEVEMPPESLPVIDRAWPAIDAVVSSQTGFVSNGAVIDIGSGGRPVFVSSHLTEQAVRLKESAGPVEVGGLLGGELWRDPNSGRIAVIVTTLIPAEHTEAESHKLSFTPETWRAADRALAERCRGEVLCGWWHSHPARHWCAQCPPESWKVCHLTGDLFSIDDRHLHRTVFPQSFAVAWVTGDRAIDVTRNGETQTEWRHSHAVHGWHNGRIAQLPLQVISLGESQQLHSTANNGK